MVTSAVPVDKYGFEDPHSPDAMIEGKTDHDDDDDRSPASMIPR